MDLGWDRASSNQIFSHKLDICYHPQDPVYEAKVREERAAPVEPIVAAASEEGVEEASAPEPSSALVLHSSSGSMQPIRRPAAPKSTKFTFSSSKKFTPEDSVVTVSVLSQGSLHFHLAPPPPPPACILFLPPCSAVPRPAARPRWPRQPRQHLLHEQQPAVPVAHGTAHALLPVVSLQGRPQPDQPAGAEGGAGGGLRGAHGQHLEGEPGIHSQGPVTLYPIVDQFLQPTVPPPCLLMINMVARRLGSSR